MNIHAKKTAFIVPGGMTLDDVKVLIIASATISHRKKGELLSALNSTALWLRRTLVEIPADHAYLGRAFDHLNFGTLGVTRARFRNVRSLVKAALKAVGVVAVFRTKADLSPGWAALRDRMKDPYAKDCLRPFFRFCSARAIAPKQVDDEVIGRFLEVLTDENMTSNPVVPVQSAIRLWNRMVDQVPEWPRVRLTPLRRREFYCLKPDQLHPDLVADIELHLSIMSGADPTHPLTPKRPLRPRSVKKRRYELFQLLAGMQRAGVNVASLRRLADLCDVDLVRKGLSFHIDRYRQRHGQDADPLTSTMIGGIIDVIRIVAKHYVQAPEQVVRELTAIASRFSRRSGGMTEKNRARLNQLEPPLVQRKFLTHALTEMGKLARKPRVTRMDAIRYSILLAIEMLIVAPMRIDNLAELDLDVHIVLPPPRSKGEALVSIPRRSVKNRVDLEYKIPRGSMPALLTYLNRFRPKLVTSPSSALFPGRQGRTKRSDSLSRQIKDLIRKELGIDWTPHVYRHLAARLYLRNYPGDYEGARRLLAHLSAETTYKFYEGEQTRPAFKRYDDVIESIRDQDAFNSAFRGRYGAVKKKER